MLQMQKSQGEGEIEKIRREIDEIDDTIADLLFKRMKCAMEVKALKEKIKKSISDKRREREVEEKWVKRAKERDLSEKMMRKIAKIVIKYTIRREKDADNKEF